MTRASVILMVFEENMEHIARAFEILGVAIIAVGCLLALLAGAKEFTHFDVFFTQVRRSFGRPLILGLEILVAADIIETITVDRSLESGAALGIVVLVRILLSFALDIEVDGMLPWRRTETEAVLEANAPAD